MKKLVILMIVVVILLAALPVLADGPGASDCGRGFGELHASLAQPEDPYPFPGLNHIPGIAHNGAAGSGPGCDVANAVLPSDG